MLNKNELIDDDKQIFLIDDKIAFRKCSLFDKSDSLTRGNCTNFYTQSISFGERFICKQHGVHFHCGKHPTIELEEINCDGYSLFCPKCKEIKYEGSKNALISNCLKIINSDELKDAKLVRVNDWYYPEISKKIELQKDSDYWMKVDVKKDKDNDTIIVLYVGLKGGNAKSQFFIKPEKLQLSSDYKDLDPQKVLAKIEVYLKNRIMTQKFDD